MSSPKTIAIIGSAIAGPTLALQILSHPLLRTSFRPLLFDQSPSPTQEAQTRAGATVGLFANGLYPLLRLGLEEEVRRRGFECRALAMWDCDYDGGRELLARKDSAMWSSDLQSGVVYFERHALQSLLVEKVQALGGSVSWDKKATSFARLPEGQTSITFADGSSTSADLLVGADGGFSAVRRFILDQRNPNTAEERWLPDFMKLTGFYGVSTAAKAKDAVADFADSNCLWLKNGFVATGPCPDNKIRWDVILPESEPPPASQIHTMSPSPDAESWQSSILPTQYPPESTISILRQHLNIYHPFSGTLSALFSSADRIIRTPLRQRVWNQDEIQCGNAVLVGDAARLMLPTSGQGTGFAIEDATVLAKLLLKHASTGEALQPLLSEYASVRVPRSRKMASMAALAANMSTSNAWYWRALRYYGSKWQINGQGLGKEDAWPFNERLEVAESPNPAPSDK